MEFHAERQEIISIGNRMYAHGLVVANDGNISMRLPDGSILCTPTGVSKGGMLPHMLPRVALDGTVIDARPGYGPSSEMKMHLRIYEKSSSTHGVVHAHPLYATAFAIRGETFKTDLMAETVVFLPEVPLAPYATPSTHEVPDSIEPFIQDYKACLLEHHGALSWDTSLESAMLTMERVEYTAKMNVVLQQLGGGRSLSPQRVAALAKLAGRA